MKTYIQWIIKNRKIMLIALLIVTTAFLTQLGRLEVIFDSASALPQNHPYMIVTNRVRALFGNDNTVVIGVTAKSGDAFQTNILNKLKRMTDQISESPNIVRSTVLSISAKKAKNITGGEGTLDASPLMDIVPTTAEGLDQLRKKLRQIPIYSKIIVSEDEKTLFITANFKINSKGFRGMVGEITKIADAEKDSSVEIDIGGEPAFVALIENLSMRMGPLFLLALCIIGLIHYEAFRTIQALALPLVTALLAVIWSLGTMGALNVPLDPFNSSTPILILAIAAGHAVQILKRYYEEYNQVRLQNPNLAASEASYEAIIRSIEKIGPVMIAAGFVASASFFSLLIFDIKVIKAFGIFTGLGIIYTMLLEMIFIPAIRAMLPPPSLQESKKERQLSIWDRLAGFAAQLSLSNRKGVYIVSLILSSIFLFFAFRMHVDGSNKGLFYGHLETLRSDDKLNEKLGGTHVLYGLFEGRQEDAIKDPKNLEAIEKIQHFIDQQPQVGKTISITDFIRRINFSIHANKIEFDRIPSDLNTIAQYLFLYSSIGDPDDFNSYVDYNYQNAPITIFTKANSNVYVRDLIDKTNNYAANIVGPDLKFSMGGTAASPVALSEVIIHEKILNILQITIMVFLATSLLFRSFMAGFLIVIPLAMTVLGNFGIMGLFGIPLQIATAVVSAMAVGIGADYAIYMTYRLREEFKKGGDEAEAVRICFASAGKAVLFVSSAIAGGYSVMMLSYGFNVHLWLGLLICTAMITSAVSSLTLFPSLILSIRPKFIFGPKKKL